MESSEDSDEDSKEEETNWGVYFALLKNRGFTHKEILSLSYPQFNAYMNSIDNPLTYPITIPYMGGGEETNDKGNGEISSEKELLSIVAEMNSEFI